MKYEQSRENFFNEQILRMAPQIARILDSGFSVELSKSRSGLKITKVKRMHEVVAKEGWTDER